MGKYGLTLQKMPSGVYPLFAVMGFAMGGLGYFLSHMVKHQEHVFDRKNNNAPWLSVQQHQTTKMYNPTGHFKESWVRKAI